jgi:hypothetical protein
VALGHFDRWQPKKCHKDILENALVNSKIGYEPSIAGANLTTMDTVVMTQIEGQA